MERIRRGEKVNHFETRRRRKDGEIIDVSVTVSPIVGQYGIVRGASIVARDITEQKRRQQEAVAKQKLESVGRLAGGIAHDFNNLLGGILAHSELALAELADGFRPEDQLKGIRAVAIRGAEIVRQLMIYAGQESEILELVDVSRIVQEMLELLKVSVSKHAALEIDLGKDLPLVRANSSQVGQVVMNLITNASDAIGERDGVISVTTRQVAVDRNSSLHTTEGLAEGEYVRLDVSDTGRGMTAEVQARVFEPFFTTKPAGHGLGLAVVQGIVRSLNGAIRLMSVPGKSTLFQVLLPCAEHRAQPAPGTISPDQEAKPLPRKATILFVEDEPSLLQAASKMFQKKGFSVIEATDGTAALDLMRAHQAQIDVLFLDVTLPGASSRDVLEEARSLRPGMPVIVTSANSEENARASLPVTFERFLRKPYRIADLIDTVCELLSPGGQAAR
jgi:two-component system cell cycle sensor histidine kinase/response regulator CckA